jgi:hypothetical protein
VPNCVGCPNYVENEFDPISEDTEQELDVPLNENMKIHFLAT